MNEFLHLAPTLRQFYANPSGKGITANNISAVKKGFISRYNAVVSQPGRKMKADVYIESDQSIYYHILVPSDTNANNYDVVIHAFDQTGDSGNVKDWSINIFSNCPSFIFTYATAYNENGMLIPFLTKKYDNKVLHNLPQEKNPDLTLGWDKSIFYAIHYLMTTMSLTQRFTCKMSAKPFIPDELFAKIRYEKTIMDECENSKMKKIDVYAFKQSTTEKVVNKVKTAISDKAKELAKGTKLEKITGTKSTESKYKVNHNREGKIIGATKIKGSRSSSRRRK